MIYRNVVHSSDAHWQLDRSSEAGAIARTFLAGEYDLLQFTRTRHQMVTDLGEFLEATKGLPLVVQRGDGGNVLVTARPRGESLLLTGRTADVLSGYLDEKIVRMEDRFDMTVRQAIRVV